MEAGIEQLEQQNRDPTNKSTKKTAIPLWKANVAVFSFLFVVVVILFFYQMDFNLDLLIKQVLVTITIPVGQVTGIFGI